MMNATSPAAKICPIARQASIAQAINTGALILRRMKSATAASRMIGIPQIATVMNAGFHQSTCATPSAWQPCRVNRKLARRQSPPATRNGQVSNRPHIRSSHAPNPFRSTGSVPTCFSAKLQQLPILKPSSSRFLVRKASNPIPVWV